MVASRTPPGGWVRKSAGRPCAALRGAQSFSGGRDARAGVSQRQCGRGVLGRGADYVYFGHSDTSGGEAPAAPASHRGETSARAAPEAASPPAPEPAPAPAPAPGRSTCMCGLWIPLHPSSSSWSPTKLDLPNTQNPPWLTCSSVIIT